MSGISSIDIRFLSGRSFQWDITVFLREFQKCFVPVKTQASVPACNPAGIHHLTLSIIDISLLNTGCVCVCGVCNVLKGIVSVLWDCVLTACDRWELQRTDFCFLCTKSTLGRSPTSNNRSEGKPLI